MPIFKIKSFYVLGINTYLINLKCLNRIDKYYILSYNYVKKRGWHENNIV